MVVLDLLLPARCGGCGVPGVSPCAPCLESMQPCGHVPLDTVRVVAATVYDEVSRGFVVDLKRRGRSTSVSWMAEAMVGAARWASMRADLVTWVPASVEGRRRRGFDQGRLLARAVGRALAVPAVGLLDRRDGTRQVGADRFGRLAGAAGIAVSQAPPTGACVLVVDDVVTTGASMAAARDALVAAGAGDVTGVAFAHKR